MKKLTLSAEDEVIEMAKRIAAREKTSVSAMFVRFIRALAGKQVSIDVPPDSIAASVTGFIAAPKEKTYRDILTDALMEKYGIKP